MILFCHHNLLCCVSKIALQTRLHLKGHTHMHARACTHTRTLQHKHIVNRYSISLSFPLLPLSLCATTQTSLKLKHYNLKVLPLKIFFFSPSCWSMHDKFRHTNVQSPSHFCACKHLSAHYSLHAQLNRLEELTPAVALDFASV